MTFQIDVFLLVFFLTFSLALLQCQSWLLSQPSHFKARAARSTVQRLLKPRTPDDCSLCRLAPTRSLDAGPVPGPLHPWREVKSRRGAPKRIDTEGFACPNQQCLYFGITDAKVHALVGDGKHGRTEHIQTFRCQACRSTFTSRRNTPLYRLKTPSHQIAIVLSALAEGLDPSAAERVFGFRHATITTWLSRAGEHAQSLHEHFFCHLQLPHLQLDELRTRLRCSQHVVWLWLAIDPRSKILPVLHLGARTQHMAHRVIYSLRELLAAFLPSAFHQRWAQPLLLCTDSPFWRLAPGASSREGRTPMAGGGGPDLRPGEKMLSATQAGACLAGDAPWNCRR
jgi:hypothetical protein